MNDNEHIGFLAPGNEVLCHDCMRICKEPKVGTSAIYRVNIGDYRQTCHTCDKVLVEGKTPAWCELFSKPKNKPDNNLVKAKFEQADRWALAAIRSIETIRTSLAAGDPGCTTLDATEYMVRLSVVVGELRILEEYTR